MMPKTQNLIGPQGQLFAEPEPGRDEATFRVDNTSKAYFNSPYYALHKSLVQPIPAPRKNVLTHIDLADFAGPKIIQAITGSRRIAFHAVGDTGAAKVNPQQTPERAIANEAAVADAMTQQVAGNGPDAPAFFFHLGDVVYYFGEAQYYYDQFYEPFRGYDRPIFAIPGNHDGAVFGQGSSAPQIPTLDAFLGNFCAASPGPSPDAGGLVRSVMTQPGVYFTLDAPFVSIIGLYSNVLEGPGVISSQSGHLPLVDDQLIFLTDELKRLRPERNAGKRAVVLGRSNIVGKPVALMLLHRHATVTICHSKTKDLPAVCREAEILVVAIGKAKFVTADMVREGAVVVDVGVNRTADGKFVGDVDFEAVSRKAGWISPVPGGVGPMTIAMLLQNTLESAQRFAAHPPPARTRAH